MVEYCIHNHEDQPKVSLHVTGSNPEREDYFTLSHRWGFKNLSTLNEKSVDELRSGITVSSLPKTFRDAVGMTLALGVKYLWIDSPCIFQDPLDDWSAESSKM